MDVAGWEKLYLSGERGHENHPTRLLVETLENLPPGEAIDLACGTGRNSLYLADCGWRVTAVDAAPSAILTLRDRSAAQGREILTAVIDLAGEAFCLPRLKTAVREGGLVLAIAHIPDSGKTPSAKHATPGELHRYFADWEILHYYEGPSRDPAHRRPVAEVVARRPRGATAVRPNRPVPA